MSLHTLKITEAQAGLRVKKFSSVELTKSCLEQIEKVDAELNSYITVCTQEAIKQAQVADKQLAQGQAPPLCGIPFSIKDVFVTKGIKTTAASKVLENYIPQYSATVYKKLRDQHAVLIGKTNCDAWGHGSSNENSDFGPVRNPRNIDHVSGGSSGGSAASVAADTCLFSIGEDTGGSIRLPASYCGVVGLKPTYGRVSRYGSIAFASSLDSVGPMAKSVQDIALVLEAIAGKDTYDATTLPKDVPSYTKHLGKSLQGLTVGLPREFYLSGITNEVQWSIDLAVRELKQLGVTFVEVSLPSVTHAVACYYLLAPAETSSNLARYDGIRFGGSRDKFGDEAKRRIMIGTHALSSGYYDAYYQKGQKVRTKIAAEFESVLKKVDVLLTPTAPEAAFRIGEKIDDPLAMYLVDTFTIPVNLTGIASLSVPCGYTKTGLPLGMQIIGPQLSEERLFNIGHQYEHSTNWHKQKPEL